VGKTYTGVSYLTGRRIFFNSDIHREIAESSQTRIGIMNISEIKARELLDSRGNPTVARQSHRGGRGRAR